MTSVTFAKLLHATGTIFRRTGACDPIKACEWLCFAVRLAVFHTFSKLRKQDRVVLQRLAILYGNAGDTGVLFYGIKHYELNL